MRPRTLELSSSERVELEAWRDHDARPYLRERAAALLKIASGQSVAEVARHGLHKKRERETLLIWLNSYETTRQVRPHAARRRVAAAGFFPLKTRSGRRCWSRCIRLHACSG